jgi:anti-anti-sigma regulatory factor
VCGVEYSVSRIADFLGSWPKLLPFYLTRVDLTENAAFPSWHGSCSSDNQIKSGRKIMPSIHIDNVGDMAVVECEGRFVRREDAFKLRDAVTSQTDAQIVVLDLTEVHAIGGGGIGMLVYLQRWAQDHHIRFKLFNPSRSVREKLEHTNSMSEFKIATLDEMMALLGHADSRYALAS